MEDSRSVVVRVQILGKQKMILARILVPSSRRICRKSRHMYKTYFDL